MEISENLYNANCTPKYFFVEKDFESWDPKIHGPCNYFQSFMWPLSLRNARTRSIIHLQFLNGISVNTRSYYKRTSNNGIPLSSSDSEMASKKNKNLRATFEKQ